MAKTKETKKATPAKAGKEPKKTSQIKEVKEKTAGPIEEKKEDPIFETIEIVHEGAAFLDSEIVIAKGVKVKRLNDLAFNFSGEENGEPMSEDYELSSKDKADAFYSELLSYSKGEAVKIFTPVVEKPKQRSQEAIDWHTGILRNIGNDIEDSFNYIPILKIRKLSIQEFNSFMAKLPAEFKNIGEFDFISNKENGGYSITVTNGIDSIRVPGDNSKFLPVED
jgi:hypothetical protein